MTKGQSHNHLIRRAVQLALLSSSAAALGVTVVHAADQAGLEEVVVTGTRLVSPNLESISPVTSVTQEDIAVTGRTRVEDILNNLPQVFAGQGSTWSNASDGTATVDLRGLGPNRTLVLVNGRRLGPGGPADQLGNMRPDINQIPTALIKRVDVLTGGASSVYGADAVAGVVNFILDTNFEGVKITGNYNFYSHSNSNSVADVVKAKGFPLPGGSFNGGGQRDLAFVMGSNFADGKGNATFYATYKKTDKILQKEYDYSACVLNQAAAGGWVCGGSGTTNPAQILQFNSDFTDVLGDYILDKSTGAVRDFAGGDVYNFGPVNYYQRPDTRYGAGAFAHYDFSDRVSVYSEFMYMNDRSVSQIAPSGAFGVGLALSCSNPLLSADWVNTLCTSQELGPNDTTNIYVLRRNVEGGGRQQDISHAAWRGVLGLRGNLADNWTYDVSVSQASVDFSSVYLHDFSITRLGRALNVVAGPDGPVCASVLDGSDPNCVPYNVWALNGVTPAAVNYLQIPLVLRGVTTERVVSGSVSGDLTDAGVKLPTAKTGLLLNVGAEYRSESSEQVPDASYQTGDGAGQGGATVPVNGRYFARDLFAELRLPLLEDMPGAHSLSFETGYRYSDYSLGFNTSTYKFGVDWQPAQGYKLRGTFQRAVRAPNIGELFSPQSVALDGSSDPCAGAAPSYTAAQCALTGVSAAQYGNIPENPASQYYGLQGGNPQLKPETADTVSFGVVIEPEQISGLSVAVDYFNIKVKKTIQGIGADTIILNCLNSGDPAYCSLIHRDSTGSLWLTTDGYIQDTLLNIGGLRTKGIDLNASYAFGMGGYGKMNLSLVGTKLMALEYQSDSTLPFYDCAGYYGQICQSPNPEWRHTLRATWLTPWRGLDVSLAWRYFTSVDSDRTSSDPQLSSAYRQVDKSLGSQSYVDLTGGMKFLDRYTLRVGINNLLDKDPPLVGSASGYSNCPTGPCNGNTYPQVYDALGRQIFITATAEF